MEIKINTHTLKLNWKKIGITLSIILNIVFLCYCVKITVENKQLWALEDTINNYAIDMKNDLEKAQAALRDVSDANTSMLAICEQAEENSQKNEYLKNEIISSDEKISHANSILEELIKRATEQ